MNAMRGAAEIKTSTPAVTPIRIADVDVVMDGHAVGRGRVQQSADAAQEQRPGGSVRSGIADQARQQRIVEPRRRRTLGRLRQCECSCQGSPGPACSSSKRAVVISPTTASPSAVTLTPAPNPGARPPIGSLEVRTLPRVVGGLQGEQPEARDPDVHSLRRRICRHRHVSIKRAARSPDTISSRRLQLVCEHALAGGVDERHRQDCRSRVDVELPKELQPALGRPIRRRDPQGTP